MSNRRPFKIEIFMAEGLPDGLRLVTKSLWIGRLIVFPKGRYQEVKTRRKELFDRSGVYLLVGRDSDQLPTVYIGESEQVGKRLDQHALKKDFWQEAIIFTTRGSPLHKAQILYLEAILVERAKKYKRSKLENSNTPQRPWLSEADQAEMDGHLEELLSILPVLGVDFLERDETPAGDRKTYHLKMKGCEARGRETSTGFMVLKGSLARGETVEAMKTVPGYFNLRHELISQEVLGRTSEGYRFTTDFPFASPSAAAAVCYGGPASGPTVWKDKSGVSLKENREKAAEA